MYIRTVFITTLFILFWYPCFGNEDDVSVDTVLESFRLKPVMPKHVRIQHIDVDTHHDIVIDTTTPHFSWELGNEYDSAGRLRRNVQQIGYHIRVMTAADNVLLWDTGYVNASDSLQIHYTGPTFLSDTRYICFIKYYTYQLESQWKVIKFRTALFSLSDWSGAWIGSELINMNQLRSVAQLKPVPIQYASAFISGIGYYQLFIEGQMIDPSRRLDIGWTTYQQRTLYASYDLTDVLNVSRTIGIGIVLGQGWYNKQQWAIGLGPRITLAEHYGPPRALLQINIQYTDGSNQSIVTDSSWLGREGEHRQDSVYMGTMMDLRSVRSCWSCANFSDSNSLWINASIMSPPMNISAGGKLSLQIMDPIRIGPSALHIGTSGEISNPIGVKGARLTDGGVLKPIHHDSDNGQIFDLGQNFAGWCKLSGLNAAKSTIIQLRYAELRYSMGENHINFAGLYLENLNSISAMDTVILNGTGNETFEPLFTYHGFRYLLVNGYDHIDEQHVECYNAHSETTLIGNFSSTSPVLNQIHHNILWSQLSNSMSLPTDCPQRNERRGWLGDAGLSVDEALFNFDYIHFYINFLTMIAENQDSNGAVTDTVPFTVGYDPADPNWGTAFVTIAWYVYEHTGDITVLQQFYGGIQAWIDCLTNEYQKTGLARMYYHWGDWASAEERNNGSLTSSYAYLRDVSRFINISSILNRTDNVERYSQLYQKLATEFHESFYNLKTGTYADGSQPSNILALSLPNVVPQSVRAQVLDNLVNSLTTKGYFTGGIVSVAALFPLLSQEHHHDLALTLALATSYPSYGYMFNNQIQNATTTWELWGTLPQGAQSSLNHHMFNSIGAWFYRYLAGINLNALNSITIHPRMSYDPELLMAVSAEVVTIKGPVKVDWVRVSQRQVNLSITIPSNTEADIMMDRLIENGRCIELICDNQRIGIRDNERDLLTILHKIDGIENVTEDVKTRTVAIHATSGQYEFSVIWV